MNRRFDEPPAKRFDRGELPTAYAPAVRKANRASLGMLAITVAVVLLVLLAFSSYAFGWTWTGFKNNTLWDWLQLLVLPVALTATTIWFGAHPQWHREWTWALVFIALVFLVLLIGGYLFNWTWTGFQHNTLWDWLKLLLLPVVLTTATVWYTLQQHQRG